MMSPLAVITGATSGIGRETARALSSAGMRIVMASRRVDSSLLAELTGAGAIELDLSSLASVARAARQLDGESIDVLINNAGVAGRRGLTPDGFELAFGVNHVGHAAWTLALLPLVRRGGRVITLSSNAHYRSDGIDWQAVLRRTRSLTGMAEYATSKLANVLFASELARRRPDLVSVAVHPGVVDTAIWAPIPRLVRPLVVRDALTAQQGAEPSVWAATADDVVSGSYYDRLSARPPSRPAQDASEAARLWETTAAWVA